MDNLPPSVLLEFYERGNAALMAGDLSGAIAAYTTAIMGGGRYVECYAARAEAYCMKGKWQDAIYDYNEVIRLAPSAPAHFARGTAYWKMGKYDDAIKDFGAAISNEDRAEFRVMRAMAYVEKGIPDKALADIERAIHLDQGNQDYRDLRDRILIKSREHFIKIEASKVAEEGNHALEGGNLDGAIELFTKAIELHGRNAAYYESRGSAYGMKNDWPKAIDDFSQAIRLAPSASIHCARGLAHKNMGAYDMAFIDFDAAISMAPSSDPERHNYHATRGSAYMDKGEYGKAIEDFGIAISIKDNAMLRAMRAMAYGKNGLHDKAMADLEQAVRLDPVSQDCRDGLDAALKHRTRTKEGENPCQFGWSLHEFARTQTDDVIQGAVRRLQEDLKGSSPGKLLLADLYSNPLAPDYRPDEAARLFTEIVNECPASDPCWQYATMKLGLMHCEGMGVQQDSGSGWGLVSKALQAVGAEDWPASIVARLAASCSLGAPSGRGAEDPSMEDLVLAVKYFDLTAELAAGGGAAEEQRKRAREQRDAHAARLKSKGLAGHRQSRGGLQDTILAELRKHNLNDIAEKLRAEWRKPLLVRYIVYLCLFLGGGLLLVGVLVVCAMGAKHFGSRTEASNKPHKLLENPFRYFTSVKVPPLQNSPQALAETVIQQNGLKVGVVTLEYHPSFPKGCVIGADPRPGDKVKRGTPVNLVVSLGPEFQVVPNVRGKTATEAARMIMSAGLKPEWGTAKYSNSVSQGLVASSDPMPGSKLKQGQKVKLWLSKGPEPND